MIEWILGAFLLLSALGVILIKNPVHAALSFLLTLLSLASFYFHLSADIIGVMQVLVYAGAILVIFVFVIVLFQDAYSQIAKFQPQSSTFVILLGISSLILSFGYFGKQLPHLTQVPVPEGFGMIESLGRTLYIDFFFPFEAVTLLFLLAAVGALYVGRKNA